jgi:hypothetical protein
MTSWFQDISFDINQKPFLMPQNVNQDSFTTIRKIRDLDSAQRRHNLASLSVATQVVGSPNILVWT